MEMLESSAKRPRATGIFTHLVTPLMVIKNFYMTFYARVKNEDHVSYQVPAKNPYIEEL